MKIAVLYQYYKGRDVPGHSLVYDLTQFLAERGHEVTVISGETGYMRSDAPTIPWYKRIVRSEQAGKVKVIRTYTYSNIHRNYWTRLLSFLSFSISCQLGLLKLHNVDVVLASSPPIFPVFSCWLHCFIRQIPFVVEIRDLWPASAVQMGILKNRKMIAIMSLMERIIYNRSRKIVALTDGIRKDIEARGWPADKIELVTCGADFDRLHPSPEDGRLWRQKYRWENKKVVLYFGALGKANNIPVILRVAWSLRAHPEIVFVLVGDGMMREVIEKEKKDRNLENVCLLPPAPKEEARFFINAADLCLVTLLDIPLFEGAIPTKLIDYMACGKPVLCGIRGEARRIMEDAGAGIAFEPDDDKQLEKMILDLIHDENRKQQMGTSGFDYVQKHFSAISMREKLEMILVNSARNRAGSEIA